MLHVQLELEFECKLQLPRCIRGRGNDPKCRRPYSVAWGSKDRGICRVECLSTELQAGFAINRESFKYREVQVLVAVRAEPIPWERSESRSEEARVGKGRR